MRAGQESAISLDDSCYPFGSIRHLLAYLVPMRRIVLAACGWLSIGLAVAGVFLPLLPTTPFVLLAVACFARSSPTAHRWVMHHRWFGPIVLAFQEGKGLPLRTKLLALGVVLASLGASMAWGIPDTRSYLRWVLVAIGIGVTWIILRLPTLRDR